MTNKSMVMTTYNSLKVRHYETIYTSRVLSRIFCLVGKSILKKIFEPRGFEKKMFLGLPGGSGPEKFENIVFRIG